MGFLEVDVEKIKRKMTSAGQPNARITAAHNFNKEEKLRRKEVAHTWRSLTKAEIAAQYTQERIEELFRKGNANVAALMMGEDIKSCHL